MSKRERYLVRMAAHDVERGQSRLNLIATCHDCWNTHETDSGAWPRRSCPCRGPLLMAAMPSWLTFCREGVIA